MNLTISKAKLTSALAPLAFGAGIAFTPIDYSETISNFIQADITISSTEALAARGGSGGESGGCCGGDNGGGNNGGGGQSSNDGGNDSDRESCVAIIEAAGTVNGRPAYRFSEGRGNNRQNGSDGVIVTDRTYRIGHTIQVNETHNSRIDDAIWTNAQLRDGSSCRKAAGDALSNHRGYQGYISQGVPFIENGQSSTVDRTTTGGGATSTPVVVTPTPNAFYLTTLVNGRLCEGIAANNDRLQDSHPRLSEPQNINGYLDGRFNEGEIAAIESCKAIGLTKSFSNSCAFDADDVAGQLAFLRNNTCPANNYAATATQETVTNVPAQDVTVTYSSVVVGNCVETSRLFNGVAESVTRTCAPAATVTSACPVTTTPQTSSAALCIRP